MPRIIEFRIDPDRRRSAIRLAPVRLLAGFSLSYRQSPPQVLMLKGAGHAIDLGEAGAD